MNNAFFQVHHRHFGLVQEGIVICTLWNQHVLFWKLIIFWMFSSEFLKGCCDSKVEPFSTCPRSPSISKFLKFGEAFLVAWKEKPINHYYMVQLHENHIYIAKKRIQNGRWSVGFLFIPLMKEIGILRGIPIRIPNADSFTPRLPLILSIFIGLKLRQKQTAVPLFFLREGCFFGGSGNLFSWWMISNSWQRKWRFLLRSANLFRVKPQIDLVTWSISGKYVPVVWEKQNAWTVWLELGLLTMVLVAISDYQKGVVCKEEL